MYTFDHMKRVPQKQLKEGKKKTKFELWVGHFTMWVQAKNDGGSITVSLGEGSRKQW